MVPSALLRFELGSTWDIASGSHRQGSAAQRATTLDDWMERQPPGVERRAYPHPTKIARRPPGKTGNADGENYGQTVNLPSGPEAVTRGRPEADDRSRRGENSADAVSELRKMTAALRQVLETSDGLDGPVVSLTRDEDGSSRVLVSAVNSAMSAEGDLVAP
ncbi:unnamed protein product [Phytophthora fragariaefolia]|uniref:Unnamed protein product n=1 Tax=Phytophthora fragariaefolia TaxID=1490495 RepID=A0A9W6Y6N8_9STRA|nr:unnamed protein product [Phytophthora fragariaefolia]